MMSQTDGRYRKVLEENIKKRIINVPDFPKPGIQFKDLTPIFRDNSLFKNLVNYMAQIIPSSTTKIGAVDARGFLIASAISYASDLPLIVFRKPGKLPGEVEKVSYQLEYGMSELCVTKDALLPEDKVYIIDDLLATGGTAKAAAALVTKCAKEVTGYGFIVELDFLGGRTLLDHSIIQTVVHYK